MHAAWDDDVDAGFAFDDDSVVGLVLADCGLEFKMHDFTFVEVAFGDLADASDFAASDWPHAALHVARGFDWFDVFFPAFDGQAQVVSEEVEAFAKTHVAERAVFDFRGEASVVEACTDFLLEGNAAGARVLHAVACNASYGLAHAGDKCGQRVHQEPRVHACAQESAAVAVGEFFEFFGERDVAQPGVHEFFAGADDCFAAAKKRAERVGALREVAARGDDREVDDVPVADFFETAQDANAGACLGHVRVQGSAGERGRSINAGDNVPNLALVEVVEDFDAQRAETDVENSHHGVRG